jgi:protoporphyrinogen oxidase
VIVIIGAGPTGLGAAHRLHELGVGEYLLIERASGPGGLASSYVDGHGFTWDVGGHVQFSHYPYYDDVLDRLVTCGWLEHDREAWVWLRDRWVPYPFQYNIHRLPAGERDRALRDLEAAAARPAGDGDAAHFRAWLERRFGATLAGIFLVPYNEKVWGYPLEMLDTGWTGERVAPVDLARLRRSVAERRDEVSWGPNNRFRFPLRGGTGAIWRHVAGALPADRLRFDCTVASIDLAGRLLQTHSGETLRYDALISTMPLDRLCAMAGPLPGPVGRAAEALTHSAVHILGVGLRGDQPDALRRKCWMYFPEAHSPYYRVTVFSNYSPHNVPEHDGCWSLMAEVCETPHRPVDRTALGAWTLDAMRRDGLIGARSEVISVWQHREEHGYPTPFLGRDAALGAIQPWLEEHRVFSRGRFGAWKYEVSNQDHSFMQGVEVADRLLGRGDEPTLHRSHDVNSGLYRTNARRIAPR